MCAVIICKALLVGSHLYSENCTWEWGLIANENIKRGLQNIGIKSPSQLYKLKTSCFYHHEPQKHILNGFLNEKRKLEK